MQRLGIKANTVTDTPSETGRVVCEPVEINLLPADLLRWQGGDTVRAALDEILDWADRCDPLARGVFIVDSVYEAKRIAEELRTDTPLTTSVKYTVTWMTMHEQRLYNVALA